MSTYIIVVRLFFVNGMSPEEIAEFCKEELKEYEHQHNEHCIKYTRPIDAVNVIIECEKKAHIQASQFEL